MKVAFIEDSVEMGGVQYSTFFLAERLIKEKTADVRIFLPDEGPFSILCQENNIPYCIYNGISYISTSFSLINDKLRIPNPIAWAYNIRAILVNSMRIKKQLRKHVPQLAVTKGLLTHFSAGQACKRLNIQVIWHLQDLISHRYYGLLIFIYNQLANKIPDHIICDGQMIKNSLKGPVCERSNVVLNGIKTDDLERCLKSRNEVRKELEIPAIAYVIGNLARITPWKGQEFLLRAFIEYAGQNKNAYLMLAGSPLFDNDRYYRHLKQLVSKNDLWDRVIMPGYRTDLKDIYSAMDIFLYPPLEKDTSPLALVSAISSGLPVAISNIESLHEITDLCPDIDTFDPRSKDEIIFIMKKYENINIRISNGIQNEKSGKAHFDISSHAMKMIQIFNEQISNNK